MSVEATLLAIVLASPARASGTVLPSAPPVAPGRVPDEAKDAIGLARARWLQGDARGTLAALDPWLAGKKGPTGRTRTAGHLLAGMAHMQIENWNMASAHFYRVRSAGGPLASFGAWWEAVVDYRRGRYAVAVKECRDYREKWPSGTNADECLMLIGDAWAGAGNRGAGAAAYQEYLALHPDTPRKEEIRLELALSAARVSPAQAIPMLQELVVSHAYHATAQSAQAALDELAKLGHDTRLPTDSRTLMRQAESARRCGQFEAAWEFYRQVADRAGDDPEAARWVEDNFESMSMRTRRYDAYLAQLEQEYAKTGEGDADLAWRIFRTLGLAGEWTRALEWGRKGMEKHGKVGPWRSARGEMAWAETRAGDWASARKSWEEIAKVGGDTGRRARFFAGLCALQSGDAAGAAALMAKTASEGRGWTGTAAHYWRARALEAAGDPVGAAQERALAVANDPTGWYAVLISTAQRGGTQGGAEGADSGDEDTGTEDPADGTPAWEVRDGHWRGPLPTELPEWSAPPAPGGASTGLAGAGGIRGEYGERGPRTLETPRTSSGWSRLGWPLTSLRAPPRAAASADPKPAAVPELPAVSVSLPDGWAASPLHDPVAADRAFFQFTESRKEVWPDLPAAYDLAQAGQYDDAGRILSAAYEEWKSSEGREDARARQVRTAGSASWRPFFFHVREPHETARHAWGLDSEVGGAEDDRLAAGRLAYPIVRAPEVWAHGRSYDVDPLLVMSIMRQESTYQTFALSPAGALGLVQVMPSTGSRVAALMGDPSYSPGALTDPSTNLRYGIYYLGLLLERFDGAFPLAVAAYNGGPHNVSKWSREVMDTADLDLVVELLGADETRDYVKKVCGYYARYTRYYGPSDAHLAMPARAVKDDRSVVDF